jgi:hypothetical protein
VISLVRATPALALILVLSVPVAAAELTVQFRTMRGHLQSVSIPLKNHEAARLAVSPAALDAHVIQARAQYAGKLGYDTTVHGQDAYKIVPGLRVEKIQLAGPSVRAELRAQDRERDDEQDFDVERKHRRLPGAGRKKSGNGKKW